MQASSAPASKHHKRSPRVPLAPPQSHLLCCSNDSVSTEPQDMSQLGMLPAQHGYYAKTSKACTHLCAGRAVTQCGNDIRITTSCDLQHAGRKRRDRQQVSSRGQVTSCHCSDQQQARPACPGLILLHCNGFGTRTTQWCHSQSSSSSCSKETQEGYATLCKSAASLHLLCM